MRGWGCNERFLDIDLFNQSFRVGCEPILKSTVSWKFKRFNETGKVKDLSKKFFYGRHTIRNKNPNTNIPWRLKGRKSLLVWVLKEWLLGGDGNTPAVYETLRIKDWQNCDVLVFLSWVDLRGISDWPTLTEREIIERISRERKLWKCL